MNSFRLVTSAAYLGLAVQAFGQIQNHPNNPPQCFTLGDDIGGKCGESNCDSQCAIPSSTLASAAIPGFELQPTRKGYVVSSVIQASPSDLQGMRVGDRIVAIDGEALPLSQPARWEEDVFHAVAVNRDGIVFTLKLNGETPNTILARYLTGAPSLQTASFWSRRVQGKNEYMSAFDHPYISGLVMAQNSTSRIAAVIPESPAALAGLRQGDLIYMDLMGKPAPFSRAALERLEGGTSPGSFSVFLNRSGQISHFRIVQRSALSILGTLPPASPVDPSATLAVARP